MQTQIEPLKRTQEIEGHLDTLNFISTLGPIYDHDGQEIPNFKRIYRPDHDRTLAVVSDKYRLVQHSEAIIPALEVLGMENWTVKKSRVEAYGARAYVELTRFDNAVKVAGDTVGQRIVISNSYDTTRSLSFSMGAVVLACTNGLVVPGTGGVGFRAKHIGDTPESLDLLIKSVKNIEQGIASRMIESYSKLDTPVPQDIGKEIVKRIVGERRMGKAVGYWTHGIGRNGRQSAWNLYNGITQYLTHDFTGGWDLRERHNARAFDIITGWLQTGKLPKEEVNG